MPDDAINDQTVPSNAENAPADVPGEFRDVFTQIVRLTDAFCQAHLNDEYMALCQEMAAAICQKGSPVKSGKVAGWASGVVHAVGWVNFLSDPSQSPHMKTEEVAKGMGVSVATMLAKSKIIQTGLGLQKLDPDWCLPSKMVSNPLVWMLKVNGFLMDIRMAPRGAQEEAFRKGLIPYIPADRDAGNAE